MATKTITIRARQQDHATLVKEARLNRAQQEIDLVTRVHGRPARTLEDLVVAKTKSGKRK